MAEGLIWRGSVFYRAASGDLSGASHHQCLLSLGTYLAVRARTGMCLVPGV